MGYLSAPNTVWEVARRQYGAISHGQLVALGLSSQAVKRRIASGRLHPVRRGVYAVGRPELSREGVLLAAVLASPRGALLSHPSAAELWDLRPPARAIHITVPRSASARTAGVTTHRRDLPAAERTAHRRIPVTAPLTTLIDLAATLPRPDLESAVNRADQLKLLRADDLPSLLARFPPRRGLGRLKAVAASPFRATDSDLERRFLALVRRSGFPLPRTGAYLHGYKTDFHWPAHALVVETDGATFHRTALSRAADARRDRTLEAAGFTCLRFSNDQVRAEPGVVAAALRKVLEAPASARPRVTRSIPTPPRRAGSPAPRRRSTRA